MRKKMKLEKDDFGKEYAGLYIFESISWAKSNEITSQCTSINPITQQSSVDLKKLQAMTLDAVMIERPKAITYQVLLSENTEGGLPLALGDLLMSMADYVNGYSQEKRAKLKKLKRQWGLEA